MNLLAKSLTEAAKSTEEWLKEWRVRNYTIQPDGTVDVDDGVFLANRGLTSIPVKFGKVTHFFDCSGNQLTSLVGAPTYVSNFFDCTGNQLTSLQGAPYHVSGGFYCRRNQLTSLEGAPAHVGGDFYLANNPLLPEDIDDLPLWQKIRELAGK